MSSLSETDYPLSTCIGILVLGENRMSFLLYETNSGKEEFSLLFFFHFIVPTV